MIVYLAGPMTGRPKHNYPAFAEAAARLRAAGHEVVSPAELHPDPQVTLLAHHQYMRLDIAALLTCEAIALLSGWESSPGARVEETVARAIGLIVTAIPDEEETDAATTSPPAIRAD